MRLPVWSWISAGAATALVASCGGTLMLLANYFLLKFGAALLEALGFLASGWSTGHALLLMQVAAALAGPAILAASAWFLRSALQVELTMGLVPPQ